MKWWVDLSTLCLIAAVGAAGCQRSPVAPSGDDVTLPVGKSGVVRIPTTRFVWDEENLKTNLGLLNVLPPSGWSVSAYDPDYVISFDKGAPLPRILVMAQSPPLENMETVSEENLLEFAGALQEELDAADTKFVEGIVPMVLGQRPCVQYTLGGRMKNVMVDRQVMVTHVNGCRYTVELRAPKGDLSNYRDDGYAVMAGLRFTDGVRQEDRNERIRDEKAADSTRDNDPSERQPKNETEKEGEPMS